MIDRIKSFLNPDKEYHHFGSWTAPSSSVRHVKIVDQPHNLKTHVKVKREVLWVCECGAEKTIKHD